MPLKDYITAPLRPEQYYHIYNRGNAGTRLFYQERNYPYFLGKYFTYSNNYWDTYAYCLLPDHFHWLIRVKPTHLILDQAADDLSHVSQSFCRRNQLLLTDHQRGISQLRNSGVSERDIAEWAVTERIRRLMLGYAKAINKQQKRYGSLFQKIYRRKWISPVDVENVVLYIHRNPVHHGYCQHPGEYPWSSYLQMSGADQRYIDKLRVPSNFKDPSYFIHLHETYVKHWNLDIEHSLPG